MYVFICIINISIKFSSVSDKLKKFQIREEGKKREKKQIPIERSISRIHPKQKKNDLDNKNANIICLKLSNKHTHTHV